MTKSQLEDVEFSLLTILLLQRYLFFIRQLVCSLYFEINRAYGLETVRMLEGLGYQSIELKKDGWDNDRMIKAKR